MSEYILEIKKSKYFQNRLTNTPYSDLNADYKNLLDEYAIKLVMLYAKTNLRTKQQSLLPIETYSPRPKETNFKYTATYLKLRAEGTPSLNDQYDYKYFEYLYKGEYMGTDDTLMKSIMNEVEESDFLISYKP